MPNPNGVLAKDRWRLSPRSNPSVVKEKVVKLAGVEEGLHGVTDPTYDIQHEKLWHRQAQEFALQGFSTQEIADMLGYKRTTISNVLRQPYAQVRMLSETKKKLADEMREFLEAEIMPTLELYKAARDNDQLKMEVRLTAAARLEDRFLGKAAQPIVTTEKPAESLTDDELKSRANDVLARYGNLAGVAGAE